MQKMIDEKKSVKRNVFRNIFRNADKLFMGCAVIGLLASNTVPVFAQAATNGVVVAKTMANTSMMLSDISTEAISVRVKAEVPASYSGDITVTYIGQKTGSTFTAVLNESNEYTYDLVVEQDIYTVKAKKAADYYTLNLPDSFTTENATTDNVYLLPITVMQKTTGSTAENENEVIKISVKGEVPKEYEGDITVNYSGTTAENRISVVLKEADGYKASVNAVKDIYTLDSIVPAEGYEGSSAYSFDLRNAKSVDTNVLDVIVTKAEPVQEQPEQVAQTENTTVYANIPADFVGTIYVCYTGNATEGFNCELSAENGYRTTLSLQPDTYDTLYTVSYDNDTYTYQAVESFTVTDGNVSEVPVTLYLDGVPVGVEQGEVEESVHGEQVEISEEQGKAGKKMEIKEIVKIMFIIAAVVLIVLKKTGVLGFGSKNEDVEYEDDEEETDGEE